MSVSTELGTRLSAAVTDAHAPFGIVVQAGEPDVVDLPTIAYWYMGVRTWEANTLSYTQELQDWHIRVYIPVGPVFVPQAGTIEDWLASIVDAIRGQLYGHVALSGAATGGGLELSDAKPSWADVGAQWCRIADMDLEAMLANVHPIAA